jgi:putative PIG3 family NAD(P)H quinone oxidoreductase
VDVPVSGGLEALILRRQPVARPRAGEVLIKVSAAGVNRGDVKQREGDYPMAGLKLSTVLGLEVAGVVVAVGPDVAGIKLGDPVCALVSAGGYAQYCLAPAVQCLPIPKGLDFIAAAAIPETFFTVWLTLFEQGQLKAGETLLVQGGASGIGTSAIQMATALGVRVLATAGSAAKCAVCVESGAELAINYQEQDFVERVLAHTDQAGVDVVLDMVGGPYAARHLKVLREKGRLCYVAGDGGAEASFNIRAIMLKRLSITGATLRHRSEQEKGWIASQLWQKIWPFIEDGCIRPIVDRVVPLCHVKEAHRALESGATIGKVVLSVE